jgi:hypothetical protein
MCHEDHAHLTLFLKNNFLIQLTNNEVIVDLLNFGAHSTWVTYLKQIWDGSISKLKGKKWADAVFVGSQSLKTWLGSLTYRNKFASCDVTKCF